MVLEVIKMKKNFDNLKLERFNGGFFQIDKPKGWQIITAGQCSEFAFLIRDPSELLRQVFYFGAVGPVYLTEQQKQIDLQYMRMGGYSVPWVEMPVVNPLTPGNFLAQFHVIAKTQVAQQFMPQCPPLEQLHIISSVQRPSLVYGGSTALIRGVFTERGQIGAGLFLVTVAPFVPFTGAPGCGNAYGMSITGVTAPQREFQALESTLVKSVESFRFHQSYIEDCLRREAQAYARILDEGRRQQARIHREILKIGQTLSETSDIITEAWETRNRTEDIVAEKVIDSIRDRERLYNPDTGQVYEFENGFYDQYKLNQNRYRMCNLRPLPDNAYDLWMKIPRDGYEYLE